jgi:ribosomal protein L14
LIKKLTKLTTLDNSGVISIKTIQLYPGNLRFGKLGDIIRGTVLTINKVHPWAKISNGRVKYIIGRKSKRGC